MRADPVRTDPVRDDLGRDDRVRAGSPPAAAAAVPQGTPESEQDLPTAALPPDPPLPVARPNLTTKPPAKARAPRAGRAIVRLRLPPPSSGTMLTQSQQQYREPIFPPQEFAPRPTTQRPLSRQQQYRSDPFGQNWRYGG